MSTKRRRTHKLKPCPFCGGRRLEFAGALSCFYVTCASCECDGPIRIHTGGECVSYQDAVNTWNERPGDVSHLVHLTEPAK